MFCGSLLLFFFFFFKQKTAYEMRISDWSSDVCSSDLDRHLPPPSRGAAPHRGAADRRHGRIAGRIACPCRGMGEARRYARLRDLLARARRGRGADPRLPRRSQGLVRSEEHTSELQSLMRISYAVFCLKKKNKTTQK